MRSGRFHSYSKYTLTEVYLQPIVVSVLTLGHGCCFDAQVVAIDTNSGFPIWTRTKTKSSKDSRAAITL